MPSSSRPNTKPAGNQSSSESAEDHRCAGWNFTRVALWLNDCECARATVRYWERGVCSWVACDRLIVFISQEGDANPQPVVMQRSTCMRLHAAAVNPREEAHGLHSVATLHTQYVQTVSPKDVPVKTKRTRQNNKNKRPTKTVKNTRTYQA